MDNAIATQPHHHDTAVVLHEEPHHHVVLPQHRHHFETAEQQDAPLGVAQVAETGDAVRERGGGTLDGMIGHRPERRRAALMSAGAYEFELGR